MLVFTDYSGGVDIGGHVAVGGSLTMQSFSVGHQRGGGDAIIAGGDVTLTNGSVHGSIVHGGDAFVNVSVGIEKDGEIVNAATVDFGQCATSICGKSQAMFELAPNATTSVEYVGDQAILHLSGINHLVNVFHVNADDLSAARAVSINIPADSTAIVNVSGEFLSLTNFAFNFLNDSDFQRLLINGPQLTRVDIHGFALDGSMLVCNADVWFDNGQMKGTLISKALSGPGEFHSRPFQGCLP